jgi:serine/threonine protein kinase
MCHVRLPALQLTKMPPRPDAGLDPSDAEKAIIHPVHALSSGQELSHYRVLSPLGAGGMGEVYLAEDLRLGRKVALKILSRALIANQDRVRRFQQEAARSPR